MVGHQVKDCQSSLSNFKNRKQKHIQETPHTLCGTHTLCREPRLSFIKLFFFFFFKGAVCPGRCEFDERFRKVEGRLYRRLDRLIENWLGTSDRATPAYFSNLSYDALERGTSSLLDPVVLLSRGLF